MIQPLERAGHGFWVACGIAGIDARTLQHWKAYEGLVEGDGRPQALRATPTMH